ncbi:methyltransferase family protein [Actinomycetospora succinea]|uniref:Methyltransferase family protein n=1 Tax=Actinomycetospora succinea TaxID=663603 RepID=A0A4V6PX45_9PSEU|nr:class I SAM-dependent methyltransferase [Actinomycetospora succinea]TDQ64908.1 methyltransferase family protein [Actinomycetospora succinea]
MTRTTSGPPAAEMIVGAVDTGTTVFDAALAGRSQRLVRHDGVVLPLAVQRWHDDADTDDDWLLGRCSGPTLDLGCGPGRLVVALADRGVAALGVDVSVQAVQRCLERGAAVLHRDAFERLPGEGRWQHVVLADGNIGIGGDPVTLLRRCRALLADGGTILLELEPDAGLWCGAAYLECLDEPALDTLSFDTLSDAPWFPWAVLGPHAVDDVAAEAGLAVVAHEDGARVFVELAPV